MGAGLPDPELTVINAGGKTTEGVKLELVAPPFAGLRLDSRHDELADARFTATGDGRAFRTPSFIRPQLGAIPHAIFR